MSSTIKLNVGGTYFETTYDTIRAFPDSMLERMFAPENAAMLKPDAQNVHFLDRDPEIFRFILGLYRLRKRIVPHELARWKDEIDFYCIDDLQYESAPPSTFSPVPTRQMVITIWKTRTFYCGYVPRDGDISYLSFSVTKVVDGFSLQPVDQYFSLQNETMDYGDTFRKIVATKENIVNSFSFAEAFCVDLRITVFENDSIVSDRIFSGQVKDNRNGLFNFQQGKSYAVHILEKL